MSLASWCVGGTWQAHSTARPLRKVTLSQQTPQCQAGTVIESLLVSFRLPTFFLPTLPFCPLTQPQLTQAPGLSQSGPLLTSIPPTPALPLLSASCPLRGQESDIWSPAPGPVVGEVVFFSAWRVGCEKKAQEGKKEESLPLAVSLSS